MKKLISFLFTLLLLVISTENTIPELAVVFHIGLGALQWSIVFMFVMLTSIIVMASVLSTTTLKNQMSISYYSLFSMIGILTIAIGTALCNDVDLSFSVAWQIITFFMVVILMGFYRGIILWVDLKSVRTSVVLYSFANAALGILQAIMNQEFLPVTDGNGKNTVYSVFVIRNALQSYTSDYFVPGTKIRAFGLLMSGDRLGLLVLFALMLVLFYSRDWNIFVRGALSATYIVAIYYTNVRTIMVMSVVAIALYVYRSKWKKLNTLVFNLGILFQVFVVISQQIVVNWLTSVANIPYLKNVFSRLSGVEYFMNYYDIYSLKALAFGFLYQADGNVWKTTSYTVDNQFLSLFLNFGLIFTVLVYLTYSKVYANMFVKNDVRGFSTFFAALMVGGISLISFSFMNALLIIGMLMSGRFEKLNSQVIDK